MRRAAAAAILILFASLNATDGICCPDGCTHGPPSSHQHDPESAGGICVLCLGGVQSPVRQDLAPCGVATDDDVAQPAFARPLDPPADPPEHPPRG